MFEYFEHLRMTDRNIRLEKLHRKIQKQKTKIAKWEEVQKRRKEEMVELQKREKMASRVNRRLISLRLF